MLYFCRSSPITHSTCILTCERKPVGTQSTTFRVLKLLKHPIALAQQQVLGTDRYHFEYVRIPQYTTVGGGATPSI